MPFTFTCRRPIILCLSCFVCLSFGFVPDKLNATPLRASTGVDITMSKTTATTAPLFHATVGLTSAAAQTVLEAAEREASAHGWDVTIVVADAGGVPIIAKRCDGAFPASYDIATGKARTAALFRKPTGALEDAVNTASGSGRSALLSAPFVLMKGGVPIFVNEMCVGAVGVSGVKPNEDEQVALASVNALISNVSKL